MSDIEILVADDESGTSTGECLSSAFSMDSYLSPASFWWPEYLTKSAWLDHAPFAFWLTSVIKPRSFVELGTHNGYSYFAFCQAVKELALDTRCYAIDTWKGDEHAGFYNDDVFRDVNSRNENLYVGFSRLIRSTFDDALCHFDDGSVDLLHIDGRHFYDDVKHDFESWRPKLSDQAIVLFHDTNVHKRDFGVYRLWEELQVNFPSFGFLHGHGLGVLGFGDNICPEMRAFFQSASAEPSFLTETRRIYEHLGSVIKNEFQYGQTKQQLEKQSADMIALKESLERLSKSCESHEKETELLHKEAQRMRLEINNRASNEASVNDLLQQSQCEVEALKGRLAERNGVIVALRSSTSWRITYPLRKITSFSKWLLRNLRHLLRLLVWLCHGRFDQVAVGLLPYYRRLVPASIDAMIPLRARLKIKRWLNGKRKSVSAQEIKILQSLNKIEAWWGPFARLERSSNPGVFAGHARDYADVLSRLENAAKPVTVVVPVYNARAEMEECVQSILRNSDCNTRIILIDDASPKFTSTELIDLFADQARIEVYRNGKNCGFSGTINRGIELAGSSDVIILNSDTKVTPGWIRNLRVAAYSGSKVATVTAISNNAGAFSVPEIGMENDIPAWMSLDEYARALSQASARSYPLVPTGHGFCMYIRRACIEEVGMLDAEAFPRGYGEENDFCFRATHAGWKHVLDDATLIYHVRSASFGESKQELMKAGRAVVDQRYPEYTGAIREFVASERLAAIHDRVRAVASTITRNDLPIRPRVMFVVSTRTGGTPQTNQDLMTALKDRVEAFVLHCESGYLTLTYFDGYSYVNVEEVALDTQLTAFPHRSREYDQTVFRWLIQYAIELVHIRHIAWHGLGLIDTAKVAGIPVVFSFHDFYMACPTINLLDENNRYCAAKCSTTVGACKGQLWPARDFSSELKGAGVYQWRNQIEPALSKCDVFVTTAESVKEVLIETYPFLSERRFYVIPHGRDFNQFSQSTVPLVEGEPIRILVPGNINETKGSKVIEAIARLGGPANLEIHILGRVSAQFSKVAQSLSNIFLHGEYARDEFPDKVRAISAHIGGIFTICPETYCHTLTELWASGLTVIGFDYGAVAERIRDSGGGWIVSEPTAEAVMTLVNRLRDQHEEIYEKARAVHNWQVGEGSFNTCQKMSHSYFDIYRSLVGGSDHN